MSMLGLIPSKETSMMIVASNLLTNMDGIENLPPNTIKAINKFLEKFNMEDNHD